MDVYSALFKNCGDAVVIADHTYAVTFANSKARQLFEEDYTLLSTASPSSQRHLLQVNAETAVKASGYPLKKAVSGESFCNHEFVLESSTASSDIWLSITGFPIEVEAASWHGGMLIIRDITDHKALLEQKLQSTSHDEFTGLISRAAFMSRVEQAIQQHQSEPSLLIAILCVDVVRLRSVNESLGYEAGDQLLVEFASRLGTRIASVGAVSRLGGDEFTLLLKAMSDYSEVIAVAQSIQAAMAEPFCIQNTDIQLEVSIGIACYHM